MDFKTMTFDGTAVPLPDHKDGISEETEAVWSANSGLNSAGLFVGTLIRTRTKVYFKWTGLPPATVNKIRNLIYGKDSVRVKYPSSLFNTQRELTGYFGNIKCSAIHLHGSAPVTQDLAVNFVEI